MTDDFETPTEILDKTEKVLYLFGLTDTEIIHAIRKSSALDTPMEKMSVRLSLNHVLTDGGDIKSDNVLTEGHHPTFVIGEILRTSVRGFVSEGDFSDVGAEKDLSIPLRKFGYNLNFHTPDEESLTEDKNSSFIISLDDSPNGVVTRTKFEYPDTSYGMNNYAALVNHINSEVLGHYDCQYTQLSNLNDDWSFVLVSKKRLEVLKSLFGERIFVYDHPILSENTLTEYTESPTPDTVKISEGNSNDENDVPENRGSRVFSELQEEAEYTDDFDEIQDEMESIGFDELEDDEIEFDELIDVTPDDDEFVFDDEGEDNDGDSDSESSGGVLAQLKALIGL